MDTKKELEQKERENCTFHPKTNNYVPKKRRMRMEMKKRSRMKVIRLMELVRELGISAMICII